MIWLTVSRAAAAGSGALASSFRVAAPASPSGLYASSAEGKGWATYSHPTKSKWWVSGRYFGKFNKFRNNRWVFGDAATGTHLARFSWTDIVRHTLVEGRASPDDPALTEYGEQRRRRIKPRSMATRGGCISSSTVAVHSAGTNCCQRTSRRNLRRSGSVGGCWSSVRQ